MSRAKTEARNTLRNREQRNRKYTVEDLNPRGSIAKGLEMSARRAIILHRALLAQLKKQGTVEKLKADGPDLYHASIRKQYRDVFGDYPERSPIVRYGWPWLIDHWLDGGLAASVRAAMQSMPSVNRKRVEEELKKVNDMEIEAIGAHANV